MKTSNLLLATLRESPKEAEILSHQLMLRAGMIRKLASGIYTWLPLGLRVLRKVEKVVREEMDRAGALEILMPAIQPREIWEETGRWESSGPQLLRMKDRHEHDFCFGPTHEEVMTDLVRHEIRSYKQLPITFYQIQTKFRDEIRPRFGVMRGREFLMKDAYSFHLNEESLRETYDVMYRAYQRIFERLGLTFRAVIADSGNIGGKTTQEFQVLADAGEDIIAYSDQSDYAANLEKAEALAPAAETPDAKLTMQSVATPNQHTVAEVAQFLQIAPRKILKTLIVKGRDLPLIALVLRGDHELNEIKVSKLEQVAAPLTFASNEEIVAACGCSIGSLGPVGLKLPMIVDYAAASTADFVCGANRDGEHLINVNWHRDVALSATADLRNVVEGDPSPDGQGKLKFARGIEVGHIFQLGPKYTRAMGATVLDEKGKAVELLMGCYGIGVSRTVAAAIEQHHDERGIIWPQALAPFEVVIVPVSMHKSYRVKEAAEQLYRELLAAGIDVLFDDRKERTGVMLTDMDLIGIPHRLVITESRLDQNQLEYKARQSNEAVLIARSEVVDFIKQQISG